MKDRETISNEWHELADAAAGLGVKVWQILKAKDDLQSNIRSEVYEYIRKQKEAPVEPYNKPVDDVTSHLTTGNMKFKGHVLEWAEEKGILDKATPMSQAIKTLEEVQELLKAINDGNETEVFDAYGDILVTIIIGAKLSDFDIEDCLEMAYKTIKDRTGRMENGTFIKD